MVAPPTACHRPASRDTPFATPSHMADKSPPATRLRSPTMPQRPVTLEHRRREPLRTIQSDKNSLQDLICRHPHTSLFVHPTIWTDKHSQFLGAHFHELPPCAEPSPKNVPGSPPSRGHLRPSKAITTLSDALTGVLLPEIFFFSRSHAVKTVLSTLWPAAFGQSLRGSALHLYFGDRVCQASLPMDAIWLYPDGNIQSTQSSFKSASTGPAESNGLISCSAPAAHNPAGLPMMAYIGEGILTTLRQNPFRIRQGPEGTDNGPIIRLHRLRAKELMPANPDHNAYLVGVFLAMAQCHFYGAPPPFFKVSQWSPSHWKSRRPAFEDLKLRILTIDIDTENFVIYTGYITTKFLDRFHDPHKAPTSDDEGEDDASGIRIEYTRVPIWPILGLKERLGVAFGEEVVGPFDASKMETWDTDSDDAAPASTKRQCEALAEVLNGASSSEEETDTDEQEAPSKPKRQRLQEGPPIRVGA